MYENPKFSNITEKERVKLYNEVWEEPVSTVAARYEISDTALRKHCKKLDIPLPYRGYWAKLKVDKDVKKTKLPKVTREVSKYVREYLIKFREDLEDMSDNELLSKQELHLLTDETVVYIKEQCNKIKVPGQLINASNEILDHKDEMEKRKIRDKESKTAIKRTAFGNRISYNNNEKVSVLPINVSKENLNRSYRIIDTLIKALPDFEGKIYVGDYQRVWPAPPKDNAIIELVKTQFYISVNEKGNNLVINIDDSIKFSDQKDNKLENQLDAIIYKMMVEGNKRYAEFLVKRREEERQWQEQLRIWEEEKKQKDLQKLRENRLEEMEQLLVTADDWDKAVRLRKFLNAVELKIVEIQEKEKQEKLINWIAEQRMKVDWFDPLVYSEDEKLGIGPYLFNEIINDKNEK